MKLYYQEQWRSRSRPRGGLLVRPHRPSGRSQTKSPAHRRERLCYFLFVAIIFAFSTTFAQSPRTKSLVLSRIAEMPVRRDFAVVAAKLRTGRDTAAAYRELDTLLSRPYGDMFWMYGCAGLYYATRDILRPPYQDKIRWCWKHFTPYRGDTENHFLMYYGSLLLMSQAWPNLPDTDWFMGKSSKEIYDESKEYLNHWIDETVRYGQEEWDSPRYGYYYITPLLLLAEYTKDPALRHRFEMMVEYELASYAADYLDGCYCGAHSRVGDDAAIDPRKAEITAYGKYFFEDSVSHLLPDVAFTAMTKFECPKIIRQIAMDRSVPYEQFSLKRGRQMLRYMNKWSIYDSTYDSEFHAPVYKYDYMTKDYCLGSILGGIVQPIQQQSWSLVFNSDKPNNIITGLNPYVSATELGMFFPEYPSFMLERITGTKASYTNEDKWVGGSPYERIYQDKNVLVALYDLPDSEKYREVDIFIPWNAHPLDSSRSYDSLADYTPDWRIFKFDSTRVGIYPTSDFNEIPEQQGLRLRMKGSHTGYIVYCEPSNQISAKDFITKLVSSDIALRPSRVYSNNDNGKTIDISVMKSYPKDWIFKSPYLESKRGSGILTIRYNGEREVLNFN